jgi:hypothetical protein
MMHFPILRTRRLTIQLQELSIGESIALASIPTHLEEAAATAFLNKCVGSVKGIQDPAHWTVQERMLAICHYLACVSGGSPDFELGDGHYSDYLDGGADINISELTVPVGSVGGDDWSVRHLTGAMAESIERIGGEVEGITGRLHWLLGGMAAQMVRVGESAPDGSDEQGDFDEFMTSRMKIIAGYPESDFTDLMERYQSGREKLHHLFRIEFASDGLVALQKGGGALPPARFPIRSCLSRMALEMGR